MNTVSVKLVVFLFVVGLFLTVFAFTATPVEAQGLNDTDVPPACTSEHSWLDKVLGNCIKIELDDEGVLDDARDAVEKANVAVNQAAQAATDELNEIAGTGGTGGAQVMTNDNAVDNGAWSIWNMFK